MRIFDVNGFLVSCINAGNSDRNLYLSSYFVSVGAGAQLLALGAVSGRRIRASGRAVKSSGPLPRSSVRPCLSPSPWSPALVLRHTKWSIPVRSSMLADAAFITAGPAGSTIRATIIFAGYVGLRPAEMFALRWPDIDFRRGRIHVSKSLGSTGDETAPKNGKGRSVVLPPPAAEALRSMPRLANSDYVFVTPKGTRFSKSTHHYYWRPAKVVAGLPEMDFYELRHFCATHLLELGLSHSDVAVQLGHTGGGTLVMSTYGHPSDAAARERIHAAFLRTADRLRVVGD